MFKKLSFLFFKILLFIDVILKFILNRRLLPFFQEFFHKTSYKKIKILGNEIKFFTPNQLTEYRVDTFFTKEPDMLRWIDNFKEIDNLIFWDIGANIGLYSIYNALKNKTSTTISFEPSTSNLRCLSRNISINKLENKIKVFSLPLTNTENKFFIMNESHFNEGGALNTFGRDYNFEGKTFKPEMKYQLLGTTINYLLDSKILDVPDYIKIDVDGIEHLIFKYRLNVYAEHFHRIEHNLLGIPGAKISDIKNVLSHAQGLSQCSDYIKKNNLTENVRADTAGSAKFISENNKDIVSIIAVE